jgi:hypothetical protein
MPKVKLYQRVALAQDLPEHGLRRGDVAVIVEHLPPTPESHGEEGYALEIFNALGETLDVVLVPASAIKLLTEDEILQARSLSRTK